MSVRFKEIQIDVFPSLGKLQLLLYFERENPIHSIQVANYFQNVGPILLLEHTVVRGKIFS